MKPIKGSNGYFLKSMLVFRNFFFERVVCSQCKIVYANSLHWKKKSFCCFCLELLQILQQYLFKYHSLTVKVVGRKLKGGKNKKKKRKEKPTRSPSIFQRRIARKNSQA